MRLLPLVLCLVLVACATPRAACDAAATRDLRNLDTLISETEGNLERGYALRRETQVQTGVDFCVGHGPGRKSGVRLRYCQTVTSKVVERPEAIDPAVERRKLAELKRKRPATARRAVAAQASCAARYPTE